MNDKDKQDMLIELDEALANFINECPLSLRSQYQERADNARDSLDKELNKPTESEDSE